MPSARGLRLRAMKHGVRTYLSPGATDVDEESIGGISRSYTKRLQEMLCIETCRHKLRSFADHHRENLFTALVNYGDLVEVDNADSR